MITPTTTDIEKLRKGCQYTFGRLIKIHSCGEYAIVEYVDMGLAKYAPYYKNVNYSRIYNSLDSALVGVLSLKYDGINTQADGFICKMLGIDMDQRNRNEYE